MSNCLALTVCKVDPFIFFVLRDGPIDSFLCHCRFQLPPPPLDFREDISFDGLHIGCCKEAAFKANEIPVPSHFAEGPVEIGNPVVPARKDAGST